MNSGNKYMNKIIPECNTMAKRIGMLSMISIFFLVVAVILLIVVMVYVYMPVTEDTAATVRNKNTAGVSAIFGTIVVIIALLISIWQAMVNGKLKECIGNGQQQSQRTVQ